jgi:hypothetical protein
MSASQIWQLPVCNDSEGTEGESQYRSRSCLFLSAEFQFSLLQKLNKPSQLHTNTDSLLTIHLITQGTNYNGTEQR